MRDNDTRGTVALTSLANRKHLYALGPLEGLRGEITIIDSTVSISRVVNGRPNLKRILGGDAAFLVAAVVADWTSADLPVEVHNLADLERVLPRLASDAGFSSAGPFPALIEGRAKSVSLWPVSKKSLKPKLATQ